MSRALREERLSVLFVTITLLSVGIVRVYSASAVYAYEYYGNNFHFLNNHLIAIGAGFLACMGLMIIDVGHLRPHSRSLFAFSLIMLSLVFVPGIGLEAGGARRWIGLGPLNFQPAEIVKPVFLLYMADFLDRRSVSSLNSLKAYVPALLIIVSITGFVMLEPDLGTAVEFALVGLVLLFASGTRIRYLSFTFAAAVPVLFMAILKSPYRLARIFAFLDPWKDPAGRGFQIIQSFIALGSGGFFGVGLGNSTQKLFYLPESHTDFLFSILGEELGFAGTSLVTVLFFFLIYKLFSMARKKNSEFSRLLLIGIASMFAIEVILNIGVSTALMPTKGLPLPFISYGGSSLVAHMALIALAFNISRERVR